MSGNDLEVADPLAETFKPGKDNPLASLAQLSMESGPSGVTFTPPRAGPAAPSKEGEAHASPSSNPTTPARGTPSPSSKSGGGLSGRRKAKFQLTGSLGAGVAGGSKPPPMKDLNALDLDDRHAAVPSGAAIVKKATRGGRSTEGLLHLDMVGDDNDLELRPEDFVILEAEVGAGAGGVVKKVRHTPTGIVMAQKLMHVEPKPDKQRMLLRELQFTKQCQHENIVEYFGAYHDKGEIYLCMEYMNCGALHDVLLKAGPLPEHVVAKIAVGVLNGLVYLKSHHRVMHRDVKPSNILINTDGEIKVCDFGVSGVLDLNSMAVSFVGTQSYMAPERLEGRTYAAQSDVWSLGLTLLELVLGRYPFHPEELQKKTGMKREPTLFELLNFIVTRPPPNVPSDRGFTEEFQDFIRLCLMKDSKLRPNPSSLRSHQWIINAVERNFNFKEWIEQLEVELRRPE